MDRITDRPDMTSAVDRGCKASTQTNKSMIKTLFKHLIIHIHFIYIWILWPIISLSYLIGGAKMAKLSVTPDNIACVTCPMLNCIAIRLQAIKDSCLRHSYYPVRLHIVFRLFSCDTIMFKDFNIYTNSWIRFTYLCINITAHIQ